MMKKNKDHPDPTPEARARGYEVGDVRLRWALVAVLVFIGFAAASHVWLYYLWLDDADATRAVDYPRSVVADALPARADPPLQPTQWHDQFPREDVRLMHLRENAVFAALGWNVVPGTTIVRPPEPLIRLFEGRRRQHIIQPATRPGREAP